LFLGPAREGNYCYETHIFADALSEVLERDRRTITKALRHIEPDAYEGRGKAKRGQWRMQTAIDALAALEPKPQQYNTGDRPFERELDAAQAAFDDAVDAMDALPTVAQRRERSIEIADLVDDFIALMKQRGEADGLHHQHIELLGQNLYRLMMLNFCEPCEWTQQEVWHHVVFRHDAEEEAA
jgi:hypothetical protein